MAGTAFECKQACDSTDGKLLNGVLLQAVHIMRSIGEKLALQSFHSVAASLARAVSVPRSCWWPNKGKPTVCLANRGSQNFLVMLHAFVQTCQAQLYAD